MGVLISDFFFLLYHYSVLRIFQSSLFSKMKMRRVDSRLSKNYIFQNVRHPVRKISRYISLLTQNFSKNLAGERERERQRKGRKKSGKKSGLDSPTRIIDKEATVQHQPRLTMKGSKVSLLSLSLSPMAEKRFEAVGVFNVGRCATARGHASYVPDNNDSVVLAVARPRESLHRGRLSADLDGNCSETTEETTLETGIPRYNEPRCRNES